MRVVVVGVGSGWLLFTENVRDHEARYHCVRGYHASVRANSVTADWEAEADTQVDVYSGNMSKTYVSPNRERCSAEYELVVG